MGAFSPRDGRRARARGSRCSGSGPDYTTLPQALSRPCPLWRYAASGEGKVHAVTPVVAMPAKVGVTFANTGTKAGVSICVAMI